MYVCGGNSQRILELLHTVSLINFSHKSMEKDFFNQMPALKIVFDFVDTRPHTHSVLKVIVLKVHLSVYQYIKTENAAHEQERKKP